MVKSTKEISSWVLAQKSTHAPFNPKGEVWRADVRDMCNHRWTTYYIGNTQEQAETVAKEWNEAHPDEQYCRRAFAVGPF